MYQNRPQGESINEKLLRFLTHKAVICVIIILTITKIFSSPKVDNTDNNSTTASVPAAISNETTVLENTKINDTITVLEPITEIKIIKQPSCPKSYLLVILEEICTDLIIKKELCTPNDFNNTEKHKIPKLAAKNNTSESRGTIVNFLACGLLLTSLGAALVELYKAKSQTPKKTKAGLSRKCSLADLTVLKHQRKELIRRESILELPEGENGPSKQLGFMPPPLHRRCSFPVGPSSYVPEDSRRPSIESKRFSIVESRRASILDGRRASIMDSRRTSIMDTRRPSYIDSRKPSIAMDSRRISLSDDQIERRHWSRLVHRH